jgi:hypothetical protein
MQKQHEKQSEAKSDQGEEHEPALSRDELWELCGDLAAEKNILAAVEKAAQSTGFAGPTSGLLLVYLAITTRLFDRPVSVALRGPSSAGKSFTLKKAAALHPPEAYLALTAMSDKALVYMKHDLSHRMLIINEAAGINGGMFAYALRSLLSEGCIDYEYTDFELKRTVPVHREGPTGLLTSAAGGIDFELATRLITPNVADTAELTRAIMLAEAQPKDGSLQTVPTEAFHALQRHIAFGIDRGRGPVRRRAR